MLLPADAPMTALGERLRASLEAPNSEPAMAGDLPELHGREGTRAAVLIAVTHRPDPGVILTVRREHLRTHAGQIAFPGGRLDPGEDAFAAALREAQEELGLDPAEAEIVGSLEDYRTVTGYLVTPIVAVVPPELPLSPHEHEVADWFEAPLAHLLAASNQQQKTAVFQGAERRYWQIEWEGRQIWGATAAIIVNLSRRLRWP